MKVNIEIDCTPEEARQFMGLPDVDKANAVYVEQFTKAMKGVSNLDQLQDYARQMAPMGQMGLKLFQDFVQASSRTAGGKTDKADD
ncbi:DUF6489 family protein [Alteriqipengyuania sp. WL0013]|uniref:DUF6489 family protein n=1 Tax=Alteriqipengyuania sp. WL0013 TaxID=3110773 RepID=UPI002B9306B4|nr:DUF6489 family protein [Alteriqipengyuania sp. WL0013]MEB3416327.1 DUF6489 family protein [Alteriqipengyuania sp. WL0013]